MAGSVTVFDLVKSIGKENVQKIIDDHGGKSCFFSQDPMALEFPGKPDRNEKIRNMFGKEYSVPQLADKFGLSIDSVRKIVNKR